MLRGTLDSRELPRVEIVLRGPQGSATRSAIVDTGFTGALAVPQSLVRQLGLLRQSTRFSQYADGTTGLTSTYWAVVDWMSGAVGVEALESQLDDVLIGAWLLRDHQLTIDYGTARSVEIR